MASENDIKMKLASKLVSMLSLKEHNEEEFFQAMKSIFSNLIASDEELESIIKVVKEVYSYSEVMQNIAEVYAKNFTEDEMIDMINFYNTPTGKIWIRKHPIILSEIMEINEKYGAAISEEILKKIDK